MCRICWAVGRGRRLCPSLYTSWTGFPIASPVRRVKHKWSVRQWRKLSCILPFFKLGHSWFQLPDTKAIWSTRTRRVTGNLHFPVFYLLLNITFLFERNPTAFLPFSDYGRSALPFGAFTGKHWPGFEGWRLAGQRKSSGRPVLLEKEELRLLPSAVKRRAAAMCSTQTARLSPVGGYGGVLEQHTQHCLRQCFLPN